MDKNNICLKDIIWVIGVRKSAKNDVNFISIPYVKECVVKDFEDLIDLTEFWKATFYGKVTTKDITARFERTHNAKVIQVLKSEEAVKTYILNHENEFKDDIERIPCKGIKNKVTIYCDITFLNRETGSDFVKEINDGFKARYMQIKEKAEKFKEHFIESYL